MDRQVTLSKQSCQPQETGSSSMNSLADSGAVLRKSVDGAMITLLIASLLLTCLITFASARIEWKYIQNYPHFYDPVCYNLNNAKLWLDVQQHGRFAVAWTEALSNIRHPFRTVPAILLAPDLLAQPLGHLFTAMPLLFAFLFLLGTSVNAYSRSVWMAMASLCLFCSVPILFDAKLGFAAFWLDLHAALAMASAAICLLRFQASAQRKWLVAFAIFATITSLSRYSATFYLVVLALPILVLALTQHFCIKRSFLRAVLVPVLTLSALLLPVAGVFVISHYQANIHYYKTYGYAFNVTIIKSVAWTFYALVVSVSPLILTALFTLSCFSLLQAFLTEPKHRLNRILSFLASVWCPLSIAIFLCVIVRATDGIHPTLYIIPLLFLPAFCAFPAGKVLRPIAQTILCTTILCLAISVGTRADRVNYSIARRPTPFQIQQKRIDKRIAELLNASHACRYAIFNTESTMPTLEAFYAAHTYPIHPSKFFTVHEGYWKGWFPKASSDEVAQAVCRHLPELDLAVVQKDPADVLRNPSVDNDYSRKVATSVAEKLPLDPNWILIDVLTDAPNGPLAVYRNRTPQKASERPPLPVPYE